jgi:hypothetical protein
VKSPALLNLFLGVFFATSLGYAVGPATPEGADRPILAAWKIVEPDNLGDVYYFYPDGLYVRQGLRRREFVTIGHWKIDNRTRLVLFDVEPRNTTLSADKLAAIRAKNLRYDFGFDGDRTIHWAFLGEPTQTEELKRVGDLPDRTENIYWGLGTDESYMRAIRRERGLPPADSKNVPNHVPDPTSSSVTPPAVAGGVPSGAADH